MKFLSLCSALLPLAVVNASVLPRQTNQLFFAFLYNLNGTTLSGTVEAPGDWTQANIEVFWAKGDSWQATPIKATPPPPFHDEVFLLEFHFSGEAPGATQFYVKSSVFNQNYYAPGNGVNYQIKQ
ncbi:hypothetical protein ABW20_dc0103469 [Dactylellina cionopaga]|nr:hypothetical protein ABW20_dc0103469 [Dactylellina cionopaga]